MTQLTPPSDRILCRMLPAAEETAWGLHLPEQAQQPSVRAEVIAVGAGKVYPNGTLVPLGLHRDSFPPHADAVVWERLLSATGDTTVTKLQPGDIVVLPEFVGSEIEYDGEPAVISVLAESVLAVET